jgi:succinate dehydrogenase/fumarate reductase flavoprotein subunit
MEVGPTAHYSMGGVAVDVNCRTMIRGLFTVGEVISQIHGANRLGGNSLLGTVVFGKIAGGEAARFAKEVIERQKTGPSQLGSNINKQIEFDDGFFIVKEPVTFLNEIQCGNNKRIYKTSKWIEKNFGIKEGILFQR